MNFSQQKEQPATRPKTQKFGNKNAQQYYGTS
jgi:hypothetical protein